MKGRPIGSKVRENIVNILLFMKKGYGYEVHKVYLDLFPGVSQRLIYYHLKKGLSRDEFEVEAIKKEEGVYSWGNNAEKTYYKLGKNANPRIIKKIKKYFESKKSF